MNLSNRPLPTPERLCELLDYDPESGALTWKARDGKGAGSFNYRHAGKPAGTLRSDGYIAVKVRNVIYAAHRLIWAMVHGEWPECVRHRNRNDADNRLANLYAATREAIREEQAAAERQRHRHVARLALLAPLRKRADARCDPCAGP